MKIYHGSSTLITKIDPQEGLFWGLFFSSDYTAAHSHGDIVHSIEINPEKILDQQTFAYHIDFSEVVKVVEHVSYANNNFSVIAEAVINDSMITPELVELLSEEDDCASWELQRIRGQVAKILGYDAVEMNDEHGVSYLVLTAGKMSIEKT